MPDISSILLLFIEKIPEFASFSVITKMDTDAKKLFLEYKGGTYVEILFDGVKNILGNDYI